jgi:chromosome segregation ATPase
LDRAKERIEEAERRERSAAGEEVQAIMRAKQRALDDLDAANRAVAELKTSLVAERDRADKAVTAASNATREHSTTSAKLEQATARAEKLGEIEAELSRVRSALAAAESAAQEKTLELAAVKADGVKKAEHSQELARQLEHERSATATAKQQLELVQASVSKSGSDYGEAMRLMTEKTSLVAGLEGRCDELEKLLNAERKARQDAA